MSVIKEEPGADTDMGPTLNEFKLVHFKQEDSPVLFCSVKSEFKQDTHGVKQDPESSAVESSSFHKKKHLIAVKQEPQGDAREVRDDTVIKQEPEDEVMIQDHVFCSESVELIIGMEDFIGGTSMFAEHADSQQGDDSGISSRSEHPGNNCSIILGVKQCKSKDNKKVCSNPQRKTYQCDLCTKSFTRQGHLTEHRRIHTGEKPYQCEICNKSFTQRGNLALHLRTHPGEKPFKCDFCTKRFTQRTHLVHHRRTHTGEKPFICDFCNKGFSQQGHLVAHTRTHTGDKPYRCHLCNRRFSSSSYLLVHTRSHSGEKPHKCDSCDKSFMQHRYLVQHSHTHIGAKPYKCEICQKHFPDQGNLARHRRTHAESIHKYVSWKVSNNMEGTLSPALEGHLIDMQ
ncbi:zinc finger protein OZF isoform X3 [Cryptotermes secundus]|uniref:zinc finger protein OZF isoform X3 n=1 Tax=Cryptotermes secundus TaxID=105785 RepID=UPI000CD7C3A6|nr:zinc finger protein OZF isoform X3 [Cryptotermes secundus]